MRSWQPLTTSDASVYISSVVTTDEFGTRFGHPSLLLLVSQAGYSASYDGITEHVSSNFDFELVLVSVSDHYPGGSPAPVPEPAAMIRFGTGLIGFAGIVRVKKLFILVIRCSSM
jgi:hypothetical protein